VKELQVCPPSWAYICTTCHQANIGWSAQCPPLSIVDRRRTMGALFSVSLCESHLLLALIVFVAHSIQSESADDAAPSLAVRQEPGAYIVYGCSRL